MTEWTAQAAVSALLGREIPDAELGWEMAALMEAVDHDMERWCRVLGLDPDADAAWELYTMVHDAWPLMWTNDPEGFWQRLDPMVERWLTLLASRRDRA